MRDLEPVGLTVFDELCRILDRDGGEATASPVEEDRAVLRSKADTARVAALRLRRQYEELLAAHTALVAECTRLREHSQQLTRAVESRDVIGQAKGVLMERLHVDAEAAFDLLIRLSQSTNTKLHRVAVDVVAGRIDGCPRQV